tara:strand:- start:233 stop:1060 length:828 start_codon:yes stop_codon:yes gene_type:complete
MSYRRNLDALCSSDRSNSFYKKNNYNNRRKNNGISDEVIINKLYIKSLSKDDIYKLKQKYNVTITKYENKLSFFGEQIDIDDLKKNLLMKEKLFLDNIKTKYSSNDISYNLNFNYKKDISNNQEKKIKKTYIYNDKDFISLSNTNIKSSKWGNKNIDDLKTDLEESKWKKIAEEKEKEKQEILNNAYNNKFKDRDINTKISHLKLKKESKYYSNSSDTDSNEDQYVEKKQFNNDEDYYNSLKIDDDEYINNNNNDEYIDNDLYFDEIVFRKKDYE